MSVRASLLAALVVGSSLRSRPPRQRSPWRARWRPVDDCVASRTSRDAAADVVAPEVTSVPVGAEPDGTRRPARRVGVAAGVGQAPGGPAGPRLRRLQGLRHRRRPTPCTSAATSSWRGAPAGTAPRAAASTSTTRPSRSPTPERCSTSPPRAATSTSTPPATRAPASWAAPTVARSGSCSPEPTAGSTASSRRSRGTTSPTPSSPRRPSLDRADHGGRPRADHHPGSVQAGLGDQLLPLGQPRAHRAGSGRLRRDRDGASRPIACGRFDPTLCRLFVQASETGTASPELTALLRAHSPKPTLAKVTAPTLLVQGMADSLFGLDQADATAQALAAAGTPYAVRWSDGGHDAPEHPRGRGDRGVLRVARPLRARRGARSTSACRPRPSRTGPRPAAAASRAR